MLLSLDVPIFVPVTVGKAISLGIIAAGIGAAGLLGCTLGQRAEVDIELSNVPTGIARFGGPNHPTIVSARRGGRLTGDAEGNVDFLGTTALGLGIEVSLIASGGVFGVTAIAGFASSPVGAASIAFVAGYIVCRQT